MKVPPHRLVLPALWLNTLFGNQVWSATYTSVGQVFYWVSLLLSAVVVCRTFNKSLWPYVLVLAVVGSRMASLVGLPAFRELYIGSTLVLFASAGVALALLWPRTLESQARVVAQHDLAWPYEPEELGLAPRLPLRATRPRSGVPIRSR